MCTKKMMLVVEQPQADAADIDAAAHFSMS